MQDDSAIDLLSHTGCTRTYTSSAMTAYHFSLSVFAVSSALNTVYSAVVYFVATGTLSASSQSWLATQPCTGSATPGMTWESRPMTYHRHDKICAAKQMHKIIAGIPIYVESDSAYLGSIDIS
jgi:hypothetical protein